MKRKYIRCFLVLYTLLSVRAFAGVWYVSPTGNDANTGVIDTPFETIQRAQQAANFGDTVYIRGGKYKMRMDQIASYKSIWAYVTVLDKPLIKYWAYKDEQPIFDYSDIKPADKRVIGFYVTGRAIHIKGIEMIGMQVTITGHTQSECFEIRGSDNVLEQISMHDGMAIGVYILRGSNNLILNCDAYNNYDPVSEGGAGGNVDGFGCHAPAGHVNNVFRGCRAWFNSDDGYDCISSGEPVLFDNCWAFYNGYEVGFISRGDGNGFKAGGYGSTAFTKLPNPIPRNTVQFCLSVKNKQSGFYSNHHLNGSNWYNNTAYLNKRNYNMLNRESRTITGYLKDVPGWGHVLRNNLGYAARNNELTDINKPACDLSHNYFDLEVTVNSSDFLSLDQNELMAPRQADGSLPKIDFLHLVQNSDLVDRGTDIGFPFNGAAPDLGCFESDFNTASQKLIQPEKQVTCYPNPFKESTHFGFELDKESTVSLSLYSMDGRLLQQITNQVYSGGLHTINLQHDGLSPGNYLVVANLGAHKERLLITVHP